MAIKIRGVKVEGDLVASNTLNVDTITANVVTIGTTQYGSSQGVLQAGSSSLMISFNVTSSKAAAVDYQICNTITTGSRAGTVLLNWNDKNQLSSTETGPSEIGGTCCVSISSSLAGNVISVIGVNEEILDYCFNLSYRSI